MTSPWYTFGTLGCANDEIAHVVRKCTLHRGEGTPSRTSQLDGTSGVSFIRRATRGFSFCLRLQLSVS